MARNAASVPALVAIVFALVAPSARAGDVSVQLDSGAGFSLKNSTGAIERLRVDEATGNVSRNGLLFVHTTGTQNLFVGQAAGNTTLTGGYNVGIGLNALFKDTSGAFNVAVGRAALASNLTGSFNTAVGYNALSANATGGNNSAFGLAALQSNTGSGNTAVGTNALRSNITGSDNQAFGLSALTTNTTGLRNVAVGRTALYANTSGSRNVAVGFGAGASQTTGNDNIYLANAGVAGESGQIKIGTVGTHTAATIAGISGATSVGGVAVLVNASGELGTTTSSARFKEDVRDMADASDVLRKLRPVVFRYREDAVGAEEAKTTQYGLIAEEVEQVAPELVANDLDGKPYSVKYHELPALLLNELQKTERTVEAQRQEIALLRARLEKVEAGR